MELLDICDENGLPTGRTVDREIAHTEGIPHRTAHVWVIRKKDGKQQILLQKRSMEKDSFPGMFDTSSAGHIPAGEEPVTSAIRELGEELGIRATERDLSYAGMFRIRFEKIFHGRVFRENEIARVYVYEKQVYIGDLTLERSEVDEVRWFDLTEVEQEIQFSRARFCVPSEGLKVLRAFLEKERT